MTKKEERPTPKKGPEEGPKEAGSFSVLFEEIFQGDEEKSRRRKGEMEEWIRKGCLEFFHRGNWVRVSGIVWGARRNNGIQGGVVQIPGRNGVPFLPDSVGKVFRIKPIKLIGDQKDVAEEGKDEESKSLNVVSGKESDKPDKGSDNTVSPSKEIETLKEKVKEYNREVQMGVGGSRRDEIEKAVLEAEEEIRRLQGNKEKNEEKDKNEVLSLKEGGVLTDENGEQIIKEESDLVNAKVVEQEKELREMKRVLAKMDWYDADREADIAEREVKRLEIEKSSFLTRFSRLFSKRVPSLGDGGSSLLREGSLGEFDDDLKKRREEASSLREKAKSAKVIWENLEKGIVINKGEDEKKGGEEKEGNGEEEKGKEEKENKEEKNISQERGREWKPESFIKVMEGDPNKYWEDYLRKVSPEEQKRLISAQEQMVEYLNRESGNEGNMDEGRKKRRLQLRWGKCLLAAKSYGTGLDVRSKEFERMWNIQDKEKATRWLIIAVHRIGKKELDRVVHLLGGRMMG